MIREEPFPVRRGKETERVWATAVMDCFWRAGYPELLGRAEEQVAVARRVLGKENGDKPATKKGKQ